MASRPRHLACCVCGDYAGRWHQHYNQDTGHGICAPCVTWLRGRGDRDEQIRDYYGAEGVNWGPVTSKK